MVFRYSLRLAFITCLGLSLIAGTIIWFRLAGTLSLDFDPAYAATQRTNSHLFPPGISSLDSELSIVRAKYRVPALACAVIRGDQIVAMGAVGVKIAGKPDPIDISSRFHIGSCTKSMTATLIGVLVDQGLLKWEAKLSDIFSELSGKMRTAYRSVTIDQLLHHRSGLPDDRDNTGLYNRLLQLDGTLRQQRMELVSIGLQMSPAAAAGSSTVYSNMGYSILGAVVERVTGNSWENMMSQCIFEPLEMKSAGFGSPGSGQNPNQPWGHRIIRFPLARLIADSETHVPAAAAASGNVSLSLEDWAKFAVLHLDAARGHCRILKCETFQHLHSFSNDLQMASGWGVNRYDWAGTVLEHAGSEGSWYATIGIAPEKNFAILTASNEGDPAGGKACGDAALIVARHWLETH
jgi:CubicO group peptidase (beta-lactamase class C family)